MKLIINAKNENIEANNLAELVELKKLPHLGLVIEYNGSIIKSDEWEITSLKDGDIVELLNFVGGG